MTTMSSHNPLLNPITPPLDAAAELAELQEWQSWVAAFAALLRAPAKPDPLPIAQPSGQPSGHCMIFAPHPDDECIVGALPLRLRQEAGWQVTNVAVTLGSNKARRPQRWAELEAACAVLGFDNLRLLESGLEEVKPETARQNPALWTSQVDLVAQLLAERRPELLLLPHAGDGIPTHKGVHRLVTEAVAQARLSTVLAETEFWATMDAPNWLVESAERDTARLVQALTRHRGEVERNPYHLRLPAFLADSVRRGGELIAGAGSTPPAYAFATLYRLSHWQDGRRGADLPARLCPAELGLQGAWLKP